MHQTSKKTSTHWAKASLGMCRVLAARKIDPFDSVPFSFSWLFPSTKRTNERCCLPFRFIQSNPIQSNWKSSLKKKKQVFLFSSFSKGKAQSISQLLLISITLLLVLNQHKENLLLLFDCCCTVLYWIILFNSSSSSSERVSKRKWTDCCSCCMEGSKQHNETTRGYCVVPCLISLDCQKKEEEGPRIDRWCH